MLRPWYRTTRQGHETGAQARRWGGQKKERERSTHAHGGYTYTGHTTRRVGQKHNTRDPGGAPLGNSYGSEGASSVAYPWITSALLRVARDFGGLRLGTLDPDPTTDRATLLTRFPACSSTARCVTPEVASTFGLYAVPLNDSRATICGVIPAQSRITSSSENWIQSQGSGRYIDGETEKPRSAQARGEKSMCGNATSCHLAASRGFI